ncbi:3-hydroxybutyryl-CoA dehydratase [Marinobacter antarcticus]|uniref:3-hydroxybutyryl-CoA dehydratase n=1 Tax=Marinobacter antarcticus TaxID=564117 RepID=A0A1M6QQU5_9GAMM|nr:MaoC family dehydratase [Marinobacter antarcticus]SHK22659.1 3-hydroxybutyryl-CoA dehydratase [Marinobacter antarcticus]
MIDIKELNGYTFEELQLGMSAMHSLTITDTDLRLFSGVSGDTNPTHLNEEYAKSTLSTGCIVHGMLTASLLSTVIGTKLPGPGCLYVSQTLLFKAPVHVGDTVYAKATVIELIPEKRRAKLHTQCLVKDVVVLDGEAVVQLPKSQT